MANRQHGNVEGLEKPKNYWALVVWLLLEHKSTGMTMVDAMERDFFHKFQTRLGELQAGREKKMKIIKVWVTKNGRFGGGMHKQCFYRYKSLAPIPYLHNLYNKINKKGLRKSQLSEIK